MRRVGRKKKGNMGMKKKTQTKYITVERGIIHLTPLESKTFKYIMLLVLPILLCS